MTAQASKILVPAEGSPMKTIWTAFPSHANLWQENLPGAQAEVAAMIKALATQGRVKVLVSGAPAMKAAKKLLPKKNVTLIPAKFGDIWLRDTGPIFARAGKRRVALTFGFNGWGGKYLLPFDKAVAAFVAKKSGVRTIKHKFILEGGALEHDGAGNILTTAQCLLNKNRNKGLSKTKIESLLRGAFGASGIIWLGKGLLNDHTDGHVDNIARFIAPGHALCQSPSGKDDPNAATLERIAEELKTAGLKVSRIPSPGLVTDAHGKPVAASHMNYIIFNNAIVLPLYNEKYGKAAAKALQKLFPKHKVIALPARRVLTGGGSFHCITQQEF